jgi:hypothetical protein
LPDIESDQSFASFLPGAGEDRACYAEFFIAPKLMAAKSRDANRPIFEDREYVRIFIRGQDKQVFTAEVNDSHKQRFPREWNAFQAGKEAPVNGTPLEVIGIPPSVALSMKQKHIRTVEELAGVSDQIASELCQGGREFHRKAKALIDGTSTKVVEVEAALSEERAKREALETRLAQMDEQMKALMQPRKRGRPKKTS